ncbi:MAG TPA: hypothetical protein VF584_26340 [Longimicrobium sp.]
MTHVLLRDGALRLEAAPDLLPLIVHWLPLLPYSERTPDPHGSLVRVIRGDPHPPPHIRPTLRLGTADAWVEGDGAVLAGNAARCWGEVDLQGGTAELRAPVGATDDATRWELYSMASLACALLLNRMGRTLAHAAGVVAPDGGAWLLVGDTHAGKSTTVANLLRCGWGYVSDDNVVLARGGGGIAVEGWPRHFHMDEGWEAGTPLGRRGAIDPRERWPGQWMDAAPLAGLLFPRVEPGQPTELAPYPAADALAALLRQSPWLLADRGSAPAVLALLRDAAARPAFALRLGLDSYADPPLLAERLRPAWVI